MDIGSDPMVKNLRPSSEMHSLPTLCDSPTQVAKLKKRSGLSEREQRSCLAKFDLVERFRAFLRGNERPRQRVASKKRFAELYNQGGAGTYPGLFDLVGRISYQTLDRWDDLLVLNNGDPLCLADSRGLHRKGSCKLSAAQEKIILNCALNPNQPRLSEAIRVARVRMDEAEIPCVLGDRQLRNLLNRFRERRANIWVGVREGERAHDQKCVYPIQRDGSRVKVGELLVADGHVNNFTILCPETGRPRRMNLIVWYDFASEMPLGWEIGVSESTQNLTVAFRRAVIALGKFPLDGVIPYLDNSRAAHSNYMTGTTDFKEGQVLGLFKKLGMDPIFAWPFNAKAKTVEGFFNIYSELERRMPSYVGTSIENKPARLRRGEKIHRALHEKYFKDCVPTIFQAHEIIADFFDELCSRVVTSGHLRGKRRIDVFQAGKGPGLTPEQIFELHLLLLQTRPVRITRRGVKIPGHPDFYYHPALFGRTDSVFARYDWHPDSSIYLFELDGSFLCEATRMPLVHPAADQLGSNEEKLELRRQIELKRHQEKATFGVARALLSQEILPEVQRHLAGIGIVGSEFESRPSQPQNSPPAALPPLDDDAKAVIQADLDELLVLNASRADETLDPGSEELDDFYIPQERSVWEKLQDLSELDRYDQLLEMEVRGVLIPTDFQSFQRYFEATEEFRRLRDYFENRRAQFANAYRESTKAVGA